MLAFLISLIFSVASFFYKKSKVLLVIVFVLMWLLFGFNFWNADYPMYQRLYNVPIDELVFFKFEGGYCFLMYFFKALDLNFQQFLISISGIILLLVFRFFFVFSHFPALLAVCFFWFFFPFEYVILRNFLAFAIVLQGLHCVLKNERHYKLKFIFFVILASTIHISSIFYLIFLLAFREKELKIKTISLIVVCLLLLVSISHHFIFYILSLYSKEKVLFYATGFPLFFLYSSLLIINLILVFYIFKSVNCTQIEEGKRNNILILNCNILMLFLIVVFYELGVFVRILFNISIVNAVFIINILFVNNSKIKLKLAYFCYLLILFFIFIFLVKEITLFPLFKNNFLLN
ncbi:EpsG family protein [Flavobacterium sp.]|uniref:EpsG family protein n=1 Tax=Flavobacterium sp. TaxID=239 RepID=UPI0038D3543E